MTIPEHLWRFPTNEAKASLAARFDLPNTPEMQDWEWEVANPTRIDEFLSAYESEDLTDDERFTLMETLIQSFEESSGSLLDDPRWGRALELLDKNIALHICSVWYWSALEKADADDAWRVTPFLRKLFELHKRRFDTSRV